MNKRAVLIALLCFAVAVVFGIGGLAAVPLSNDPFDQDPVRESTEWPGVAFAWSIIVVSVFAWGYFRNSLTILRAMPYLFIGSVANIITGAAFLSFSTAQCRGICDGCHSEDRCRAGYGLYVLCMLIVLATKFVFLLAVPIKVNELSGKGGGGAYGASAVPAPVGHAPAGNVAGLPPPGSATLPREVYG